MSQKDMALAKWKIYSVPVRCDQHSIGENFFLQKKEKTRVLHNGHVFTNIMVNLWRNIVSGIPHTTEIVLLIPLTDYYLPSVLSINAIYNKLCFDICTCVLYVCIGMLLCVWGEAKTSRAQCTKKTQPQLTKDLVQRNEHYSIRCLE